MTESRLPEYLDQMRQAASNACEFVDGWSKEAFLADKRTQMAVIMSLMIVGEAATRIVDQHSDFAARHAEIPWRNIRGMRNRIAHGYFEVNLDVVWETISTALPDLLKHLSVIRIDTASTGELP